MSAALIPATLPLRLAKRSRRNFYNVFEALPWEESLAEDVWWMSPELLTVHGTRHAHSFSESTLKVLSKWETINLFSVFTQGESDLIQAIIERIHQPFLEGCFDYLVHFIDEENKHMWFFSEFCRRYGGKVYPSKKIKSEAFPNAAANDFAAFMRIVVFEEMGDAYNTRVMGDKRVHGLIREIHRIHHQDEAGHLAIGREISLALFERMRDSLSEEEVAHVATYVEKYSWWMLQNVYNPAVYQDAGVPEAYEFRNSLMRDPGRMAVEESMLARIRAKFEPVFRHSRAQTAKKP